MKIVAPSNSHPMSMVLSAPENRASWTKNAGSKAMPNPAIAASRITIPLFTRRLCGIRRLTCRLPLPSLQSALPR